METYKPKYIWINRINQSVFLQPQTHCTSTYTEMYFIIPWWKIFKCMFLTFPDHNPPFPHTASRVYFLPVVHRPKSPEQQNLYPSRNLFQPRNRRGGEAQYNVQLSFSTFRAYSEFFDVVRTKSGSTVPLLRALLNPSLLINCLDQDGEKLQFIAFCEVWSRLEKRPTESRQYYYNNLLINIRKITHRLWCYLFFI